MQRAIPYAQLRGGSSKGVYLSANDLPTDIAERNKVVLAIMEGVGGGDPRQMGRFRLSIYTGGHR